MHRKVGDMSQMLLMSVEPRVKHHLMFIVLVILLVFFCLLHNLLGVLYLLTFIMQMKLLNGWIE
jgi:hypothetical protein